MIFVMLNMFVSIINDTFAMVQEGVSKQSNDYEIVEFMMTRLEQWTGIPFTKMNSEEKFCVGEFQLRVPYINLVEYIE